MGKQMTREQKQTAFRLSAKRLSLEAIARDLNFSLQAIRSPSRTKHRRIIQEMTWTPAPGRLSADEREEILVGCRVENRCPPLLVALVEPLRRSRGGGRQWRS